MIVIDPGHGGNDPGAIANGIVEKDYNLMISRYMYDRFRELGVPVVLTRSVDETLSSEMRVQRILQAFGNRPDVLVLSNHLNASGGDGAEVIYALRNTDTLSRLIAEELAKAGQNVRRWYQRRLPSDTSKDYYFIHRNTGATEPVLIEYGFVDSPGNDPQIIKTRWRDLAEAVVRAVSIYKGYPYDLILEEGIYTVQPGDTLYSIARRFNVSVSSLKNANNLVTDTLSIGQKLIIPGMAQPPLVEVTYIVQPGDTLYSIARAYDTTVSEIMTANNLTTTSLQVGQILKIPTPEPPVTEPIEPTPPPPSVYTVRAGDTLFSIARQFGTTVQALRDLNNLTTDILVPGQVLKIPLTLPPPEIIEPPTITYTVKKGDNLYDIARRYGTTVEEIMNLNNLTTTALSIGQILQIPTVEVVTPPTITYTVKKGDNLYDIARRYGTIVEEIMRINNLTTTALSIGQTLKIPTDSKPTTPTTTYTVKKGDNLYSIAQKFGTTVAALRSLNNLTTDLLSIGQILLIPTNSDRQEEFIMPEEFLPFEEIPALIKYTVRRGDSLYSIAQRFKTSVPFLRRVNNLTTDLLRVGQELLVPTTPEAEEVPTGPTMITYTVKKGDTLWSIARRFGTTVSVLRTLNNIATDLITIGQELLVPITPPLEVPPATTVYIVKRGDTLWDIAREFNTDVATLKELNNLTTDLLSIGQILFIPLPSEEERQVEITEQLPVIIRYRVERGDTLASIANKYGTNVEILRSINNLTTDILRVGQELLVPKTPLDVTIPIETPTVAIYTVEQGNTLWSIARQFGTTVAKLKELNQLTNNLINVGQELLVPITPPLVLPPGTTTYIVKPGDTLFSIAKSYNTTVDNLKTLNQLTDDLITVGQILLIPLG